MKIETAWAHATTDIPADGLRVRHVLDGAETIEIAAILGVPAVGRLEVRYRIKPRAAGCFDLKGELHATVTQECVVTLEPVTSTLREPLELEFRPAAAMPASDGTERSALSVAEIEPIENGQLPVGRIVLETLAAALDPYPRAPGASFDGDAPVAGAIGDSASGSAGSGTGASGPFAVLARLKTKPE